MIVTVSSKCSVEHYNFSGFYVILFFRQAPAPIGLMATGGLRPSLFGGTMGFLGVQWLLCGDSRFLLFCW